MLNRFGGANELWDWDAAWFWGQETVLGDIEDKAARGYISPGAWNSILPSSRTTFVGFRPVLEKLPDMPKLDELIGGQLVVYGTDHTCISGELVEADDYDIVLALHSKIPSKCIWARRNKGMVIISRADVIWMEPQEITT